MWDGCTDPIFKRSRFRFLMYKGSLSTFQWNVGCRIGVAKSRLLRMSLAEALGKCTPGISGKYNFRSFPQ